MEIKKTKDGEALKLELTGRLDTTTAPQLETEVSAIGADVKAVEFDFAGLEYVSSAGLRVLLAAQKLMNKQGSMVLKNVRPEIMEVFEITGFADILTIQ